MYTLFIRNLLVNVLASCALHLQYDKKVPYSGPVYKSMQIKDNKAEIVLTLFILV